MRFGASDCLLLFTDTQHVESVKTSFHVPYGCLLDLILRHTQFGLMCALVNTALTVRARQHGFDSAASFRLSRLRSFHCAILVTASSCQCVHLRAVHRSTGSRVHAMRLQFHVNCRPKTCAELHAASHASEPCSGSFHSHVDHLISSS